MDLTGFSLIGMTALISLIIGYLFLTRAKVEKSFAAQVIQLKTAAPKKIASDGFTGVQEKYQSSFVAPNAEILIVDDNEINLLTAKKLLQATRVKIDTAASGVICLEKIAQKHYDLIFMEQLMPNLDGIQTLKMARAMNENLCKDTPVIAFTALDAREMLLAHGFTDYLSKPVDMEMMEFMLLTYLPLEKIHSPKVAA
mgnify:CR=1 FL=1